MSRFLLALFLSVIILATPIGWVVELRAEVTMPPVFGDHMILQRGITIPVWGSATPGESVSVSCLGRYAETCADSAGHWRVTLRPLSTSYERGDLVVNGVNRIEIHDVIAGDVWICVGEGNMQMPLSESSRASEGAILNDQALRFFNGEKWTLCTPETAIHFSAVGYFFARDLRAATRLPIGIISCTAKNSSITSWISRSGLSASPSILPQKSSSPHSDVGAGNGANAEGPSSLFQSLIAPLIPYAMTGVIWYQGESDDGPAALQYRLLLPRLIRDWRSHWGEGPFPFYFVSLAGFGSEEGSTVEIDGNAIDGSRSVVPRCGWPWIREGIASTLSLPSTGMAVASDLGLQDDRYPADKLNVGRRLALLARHRVYDEKVVDEGPAYLGMKIEGNKVRVEFDPNSTGGGLTLGISPSQQCEGRSTFSSLSSLSTGLRGFAVAGSDHKWFPAKGKIVGSSVLVSSDAVLHPLAVRYNWRGFPIGNLYNKEGLPAPPFRSDTD